jgi:hypothetical protein
LINDAIGELLAKVAAPRRLTAIPDRNSTAPEAPETP